MVPGKEANGDNLRSLFYLLYNNGMLSVHIRIASMRRFKCVNLTFNFMIKNPKYLFLELSEDFSRD